MAYQTEGNNVLVIGGKIDGSSNSATFPVPNGASLKTIGSRINGSTADNYIKLGLWSNPSSSAAQYQVTSGKTFISFGIYLTKTSTAASAAIQFGYGTAALVAFNTATAPTGDVIYGATNSAVTGGMLLYANNTTASFNPFVVSFPSLAFPYWRTDLAGADIGIVVLGYEL